MSRILLIASLIISASAVFTLTLPSADGCASLPPRDGASIHIAEESAIIVWDPVKKVQHFIRRAAFDTKSPDFGFLVPTPTMPELPLKTVEDGIFSTVDTWLVPRTVEKTRWRIESAISAFLPSFQMSARLDVGMAPNADVRVLHEQKVGGFDVSVLEADDADALAKWITKQGYSADPELYEWLTPYVASKWKISAFKISHDPTSNKAIRTKAVRMSFKADRPFFPYREPEGKKQKDDKNKEPVYERSRLLRVLFVSEGRYDGQLGAGAWKVGIPWSDALTDEQRQRLIRETGVPEDSVPAGAWLTTFEDRASPRPGKDEVYFEPSSDRSPIRPPDVIKYTDVRIPIDCLSVGVIFAGLMIFTIVRAMRRKRVTSAPR